MGYIGGITHLQTFYQHPGTSKYGPSWKMENGDVRNRLKILKVKISQGSFKTKLTPPPSLGLYLARHVSSSFIELLGWMGCLELFRTG